MIGTLYVLKLFKFSLMSLMKANFALLVRFAYELGKASVHR